MRSTPVVVVGSGLAAAAAAWALSRRGVPVTLIEERDPGGVTIPDEERYCAWWPGIDESMARLVGRGIGLLEQLHLDAEGDIAADRRGHLFLTHRGSTDAAIRVLAGRQASQLGTQLREHATAEWYLPSPEYGMKGVPDGLDFLDGRGLQSAFPFLAPSIRSGLQVRRAGTVDGRSLRRWLLGVVRMEGGTIAAGQVIGADRLEADSWVVRLADGGAVPGRAVVLAGGRAGRGLGRQLGVPDPATEATWVVARLTGMAPLLPPGAPVLIPCDELLAGDPMAERGGCLFSARSDRRGDLVVEATATGSRRDQAPTGDDLLRELAGALPALVTHRGPPSRLTSIAVRVALAPDGRPIVGPWRDGLHLLSGATGGVPVFLAAAELLADGLAERPAADGAAAFAPARFHPDLPRVGLPEQPRVDFSPRIP